MAPTLTFNDAIFLAYDICPSYFKGMRHDIINNMCGDSLRRNIVLASKLSFISSFNQPQLRMLRMLSLDKGR